MSLLSRHFRAEVSEPEPEPPEWTPGDPIYNQTQRDAGSQYRTHLFNFRDDPATETCGCGDAASWPEPSSGRRIPEGDELGALIESERAARRREENR